MAMLSDIPSENIGILIIFAGILLILIGMLVLIFFGIKGNTDTHVEGAFIGFIGPIPIVLGTSRQAIMFALLFFVITLVFFLLFLKSYHP